MEKAWRRRRHSSSGWTAMLLLVLGGCTPQRSPERSETVVYASGADLQSINPLLTVHPLAKAVQKYVLFLTLAQYDSTLAPQPRLASWQWSDQRRVLTLHVRRDIRWADGARTDAGDVVWTLYAARDPAVAYPRARDLAGIAAIERVDSFTVRLRFARSQPTFPDVLTDLAILPAHRFTGVPPESIRVAAFNRAPLGNGPLRFIEYRPNQRWVFARDPSFPAELGRPGFERLVIVVVDEPASKLSGLTSGELDFAGIAPAHAAFVRHDPRLQVIDYPFLFVYGVVWNLRRPPFDNRAVRRALTMAIDRRLLVRAYLYGFGTVAHGPVPPEHPWYEPVDSVPFDPAGAQQVLDSLGWIAQGGGAREKDGRRLAFTLLTVGSGDLALEQMIQAQLKVVGVEVVIRRLELSTFLDVAQGRGRDFDALVLGIPGDLTLSYVAAMFGGSDGPLAYSGYHSAAFEAALNRADDATSRDALVSAWHEAQRVLARDLPVTWLYHARGLQGANRRIEHARPDLRGELSDLSGWRVRAAAR